MIPADYTPSTPEEQARRLVDLQRKVAAVAIAINDRLEAESTYVALHAEDFELWERGE